MSSLEEATTFLRVVLAAVALVFLAVEALVVLLVRLHLLLERKVLLVRLLVLLLEIQQAALKVEIPLNSEVEDRWEALEVANPQVHFEIQ